MHWDVTVLYLAKLEKDGSLSGIEKACFGLEYALVCHLSYEQ